MSYWFPAKRYGWGWGLPSTWQGWAVLAAFVLLLVASFVLFQLAAFLICAVFLAAALTAICWLKGEPPRWRWGSG